MLTESRRDEILTLVAQLPEAERVLAAVAMVVGWSEHLGRFYKPGDDPGPDNRGHFVPVSYTTSLDAFMADVEPWMKACGLYVSLGRTDIGWQADIDHDEHGCSDSHPIHAHACCLALLCAVGLGEAAG